MQADYKGQTAAAANDAPLLAIQDLSISHGRNPAVQHLSFTLRRGDSLAIAGSNGAGKTSLLSVIAGVSVPTQSLRGQLSFNGVQRDLGGQRRHIDPAISLVPERAKVFGLLTVDENLRVGIRTRRKGGLSADDIFGWFPSLKQRRATLAGNLSGGEQQMLGIGLGLMTSPSLLLLDEPTLGLAVPVIDELCERLATLRGDLGLTVIVAESDSQWLPRLAERALVIDRGVLVERFDSLQAGDLDAIHDLMLGIGISHGDDSNIAASALHRKGVPKHA